LECWSAASRRRRSLWEPGASSLGIPFNPTSERAYPGGNAIHLMATGLERGYEDPRWMTYKQASDNGWQVRRGEKGTQIEYWETKHAPDRTQPAAPKKTSKAETAAKPHSWQRSQHGAR
jgi:antirestriction protein ArdC